MTHSALVARVSDIKKIHPEEMAALLTAMTKSLESVEAQLDSVHLEASKQVSRMKAEKAEIQLQLEASERARQEAEQAAGADAEVHIKLATAQAEIARLTAENKQLAEICGSRLAELDAGQGRLSNMLSELRSLTELQFPDGPTLPPSLSSRAEQH